DTQTLNKSVEDYISESNLTIDNEIMYSQFSRSAIQKDNQFSYYQSYTNGISEIVAITQKDYNHLASTNETLSTGEILLYSKDDYPFDTLVLEGINYNIKKQVPRLDTIHFWGMGNEILIVVPTFDDLCTIAETFNSLKNNNIRAIIDYQYKFDLVGDKAEKEQVFSNMRTRLLESNEHLSDVSSRDANRLEFYSLYGCVVFVGAFFIVLFTIAAVLIIYYKQITEGFDDHDRFKIMQKVGMSQKEVKATISKQVLLVFFMPLLLASVHLAFAFPSLTNILRALNLSNMTLFTLCCIGTVLVFALLYLIVYALTAKTYYKI
ncbi:MAG: FtsX-like permease family protein, partial [Oscillospiraceae bacterium]